MKNKNLIILGSKIREKRLNKNLSLLDVSYLTDIEKPNISRIENGKVNVTIKTIFKICDSLEIDIKDLFL